MSRLTKALARLTGATDRGRVVITLYVQRGLSASSTATLPWTDWAGAYLSHLAKTLYTINEETMGTMLLGAAQKAALLLLNASPEAPTPMTPTQIHDALLESLDLVLVPPDGIVGSRFRGQRFTIDLISRGGAMPTVLTSLPPGCTAGEIALSTLAFLVHVLSQMPDASATASLGALLMSLTRYYAQGGSYRSARSVVEAPVFALQFVRILEGKTP